MLKELKKELRDKADPDKAKVLQGFFKTGVGQYGEGNLFLGEFTKGLTFCIKRLNPPRRVEPFR